MSRSAPDRSPISSPRAVRSGISTRERMRWRTRSALSASRFTGPAMVRARNIDSTTMTPSRIRNSLTIWSRSASTAWLMSPPCVDSSSAPRTARKRCTGTATETMTSPAIGDAHQVGALRAGQRLRDLGIVLAGFRTELVVARKIAAAEPHFHGVPAALEEVRLLLVRRRQVEAQHLAGNVEVAAVENEIAVAVVDARARLGRRDQPAQDRRDALGIDRELEAGEAVVGVVLDRRQVEQAVAVAVAAVAVGGGGGGDRAGDDLALHHEALHPRVDQAGAELRQIEDADDERDQARDVERDDAAGEAREALGDEELPGALGDAAKPALAIDPRDMARQHRRTGYAADAPPARRDAASRPASACRFGGSIEQWGRCRLSCAPAALSSTSAGVRSTAGSGQNPAGRMEPG